MSDVCLDLCGSMLAPVTEAAVCRHKYLLVEGPGGRCCFCKRGKVADSLASFLQWQGKADRYVQTEKQPLPTYAVQIRKGDNRQYVW